MVQKLHDILIYLDFTMWYYLNTVWHNNVLDTIIPFFRNQWTWAPLYLFLLFFMLMNYKRRGMMWCVFFLLSFALSDYISASVFKDIFHRIRPCNNPALNEIAHVIVPCGGGYSFPSSHASNHFALAVFSAITLRPHVKWIWPAAITWAALVAYAQVYVGVHYPWDVICGALFGTAMGMLTSRVFNKVYGLEEPAVKEINR